MRNLKNPKVSGCVSQCHRVLNQHFGLTVFPNNSHFLCVFNVFRNEWVILLHPDFKLCTQNKIHSKLLFAQTDKKYT